MEHFYQEIDGWMELDKVENLFGAILNYLPNRMLNIAEIGVYKGRGTALINVYLINRSIDYSYYAIDHFKGSIEFFQVRPNEHSEEIDYYSIALDNLKELLKNDNIKLIKNDSVLESQNYDDEFFDIVYIDGAHDYDSVKKDITSWLPKVKKNGIICGDDYTSGWPGVVKSVDEFFGNNINVAGIGQWWVRKSVL